MNVATDLVRRFLPAADHRTLVVAAIWLLGQCGIFVRNSERLAASTLSLDESAVEWLTGMVSRWAIAGLSAPA
jgi:hypothetical protein